MLSRSCFRADSQAVTGEMEKDGTRRKPIGPMLDDACMPASEEDLPLKAL
jgi:hypothetical protein